MAVTTKKIITEIVVCDSCGTDVEDKTQSTRLTAKADGFFSKDKFEMDLCMTCGDKFGLKRRGRKPNNEEAKPRARRATPRLQAAQATTDAPQENIQKAVDDWED